MVERHRKKKNRLRGHRTHGAGNTKNRRGSGSRGGVGRGGSKKSKFTKYYMTFGVKVRLTGSPAVDACNLDTLDALMSRLVLEKKLAMENGLPVFDGEKHHIGKILGRGNVSRKMILKNVKASKSAAAKLQAAGCILASEQASEEESH